MKTIHKVNLKLTEIQRVSMPKGAVIQSIQMQRGLIACWFECDTDKPHENRQIVIVGTGHPVPPVAETFIATIQIEPFVWHIYEGNFK